MAGSHVLLSIPLVLILFTTQSAEERPNPVLVGLACRFMCYKSFLMGVGFDFAELAPMCFPSM